MEEIDLKELFEIFWEKKAQIIVIVSMFIILGVVYTISFVTPKYESSTTLLLATNNSPEEQLGSQTITTTDVTLNSKLVSTYSVLVKSDKITRAVISNLGIDADEDAIKNSVTVKAKEDTQVMEIAVRNEDPKLAAKIANEIAEVFIENVKEYYKIDNLHVVDEAEINPVPANINHTKDVVIFAFIGIVVSVVYVLLVNMLDTTIKSEEDIEKISGVRVLATLPLYENRVTNNQRSKRRGR